jgi:hypothetical protein
MADAQQATLQHSDRPGKALRLRQAGQVPDRFDDRGGGLVFTKP